ncbi:hypothetical protein B0H13DRAFT_683592 [Mycena leptocephala]|nr:hypothetical protein B0H13DRAFT_683592 [Mycena leptocephala]
MSGYKPRPFKCSQGGRSHEPLQRCELFTRGGHSVSNSAWFNGCANLKTNLGSSALTSTAPDLYRERSVEADGKAYYFRISNRRRGGARSNRSLPALDIRFCLISRVKGITLQLFSPSRALSRFQCTGRWWECERKDRMPQCHACLSLMNLAHALGMYGLAQKMAFQVRSECGHFCTKKWPTPDGMRWLGPKSDPYAYVSPAKHLISCPNPASKGARRAKKNIISTGFRSTGYRNETSHVCRSNPKC